MADAQQQNIYQASSPSNCQENVDHSNIERQQVERTLTDHLNKRLLNSYLEQLNLSENNSNVGQSRPGAVLQNQQASPSAWNQKFL